MSLAAVVIAATSLAAAQAPPPLPPENAPPRSPAAVTQPAPSRPSGTVTSPTPSRGPMSATPAQPAQPGSSTPPGDSIIVRTPSGAEAHAGDAPVSRWQGDLDRLDSDLRLRLITANEPRVEWLAGEIETADIEAQVRHYASARTSAPGERLYLASLGVACLQPTRPSLAPCDAMDRLADWARRDGDNGVPMLLLAGRARHRGEAELAAMFLEQAALAPRFDDYWSQGAARWWSYLRALDAGIDPAAKAKAALNYAAIRDVVWAAPLRALCVEGSERAQRMRAACMSVGRALAERGATFALRLAGVRIAELNASDASAQAAAQRAHARVLTLSGRCAQATPDFSAGLESAQAAERAAAIDQFGAWASAQADLGEVNACERLIASARR